MSASSTVPAPSDRPAWTARSGRKGGRHLEDDHIFAKVHGVAIQAALAILLSLVGLGSATAQSVDRDMALGANTQATRDRVISEIRQAREDGAIKRWSPVFVEVPFKAPPRGSRFAPFATHQADGEINSAVPDDAAGRWSDVPLAAARAAQ